ncbi:hypothetical protein HYW61_02055 [candidate division WWE3 bacterium]|nr:hypothetical protein [candidate division WWE3 bacterium]
MTVKELILKYGERTWRIKIVYDGRLWEVEDFEYVPYKLKLWRGTPEGTKFASLKGDDLVEIDAG